jgi:hypothetical protein
MFHGLGSRMPSSVARRIDPGRHTFVTLKGPLPAGGELVEALSVQDPP